MVELIVNAPDGQVFRGANWRLYNPETHQWSTNYANASVGVISTPGIGGFKNGVGEFYDQEELAGRVEAREVRDVEHHSDDSAFRTVLFDRRRTDLGSELGRRRHPRRPAAKNICRARLLTPETF